MSLVAQPTLHPAQRFYIVFVQLSRVAAVIVPKTSTDAKLTIVEGCLSHRATSIACIPKHSHIRCELRLYKILRFAMQSFLVAVVIPEKKDIQSFAKQQGISGDYSDILKDDKVSYFLVQSPVLQSSLVMPRCKHGCTRPECIASSCFTNSMVVLALVYSHVAFEICFA